MSRTALNIGMNGSQLFNAFNNDTLELYNVTDIHADNYGAKHDGITDDIIAIQAAIDACNAKGGGVVRLATGVHLISSTINLKSGVKLIGNGNTVTYIKSSVNNISLITIIGITKSSVNDLSLHGNSKTGIIGIDFKTTHSLWITLNNIEFIYLKNGISLNAGITGGIYSRCEFHYNTEAGFLILSDSWISELELLHCYFEQTTGEHVKVINAGDAKGNMTFNYCVFESSTAEKAVDMGVNMKRVVFYQCGWENNGGTNINSYDIYFGAGNQTHTVRQCTFADNTIGVTGNCYSVYCGTGANDILLDQNRFACLGLKDIAVYIYPTSDRIILNNNNYGIGSPVNSDTKIVSLSPVCRINDDYQWDQTGGISDNRQVFKRTTNATPSNLFEWNLGINNDKSLVFLTLDVLAVNSDGSKYAAYTRKALIKFNRLNSIDILSIQDITTIEINSAWDCVISVADTTNGIISAAITGEAGVNIAWTGSLKYIIKRWTD